MAERGFHVFSYLNADKSEAYRAVMRVFMQAKARFALHLRPSDVRYGLANESASNGEAVEDMSCSKASAIGATSLRIQTPRM
jgi:Protein of unknown function (DUF2397)